MNRLFSFLLMLVSVASIGFFSGCAAPAPEGGDDDAAAAAEAPAEQPAAEEPEAADADKPAEEPEVADADKPAEEPEATTEQDEPAEEEAKKEEPKKSGGLFGIFGGGSDDKADEEEDKEDDLLDEAVKEDQNVTDEDLNVDTVEVEEAPEEEKKENTAILGFIPNPFAASDEDVQEAEEEEIVEVDDPDGETVTTGGVLWNMSPRMDNMSQTHMEAAITRHHTWDTNGRMFWNDLRTFLLWDRPSRLSRYPQPTPRR